MNVTPRSLVLTRIEVLEPRIAPAVLFTYTEADGDFVTVKISKGDLGDVTFTHPPVPGLFGDQLENIDLNGNQVFKGANITIEAKPQDLDGNGTIRGDGFANVGFINATGIDLGTVKVDGDLAKIVAGDATLTTPGLKSLQAVSLGRFNTGTGAPDRTCSIEGALGSLVVQTDLLSLVVADGLGKTKVGGRLEGSLFINADMGYLTVGGDLTGSLNVAGKLAGANIVGSLAGDFAQISSNGDMGSIKIGRDLRITGNAGGGITSGGKLAGVKIGVSFTAAISAGSITASDGMGLIEILGDLRGADSGGAVIFSSGKLAGVRIGGSVYGDGPFSARIQSTGDVGSIQIRGDLIGGRGDQSASIEVDGKIGSVTIGGSIVGGQGDFSASLISTGDLGTVKIAGDLRGGTPNNGGDPSIDGSGYIEGARIARISIGGSIIAGRDFNPADAPTKNASIRARDDIGSLTIKGSLRGNTNGDDVTVIISARGQRDLGPTATKDVAIGKLSIGGGTFLARILAGYDPELFGRNADAQIGAVTIGGDVLSTDLIAGVHDNGDGFGNFNDTKLGGMSVLKDNADGLGAISRIASIQIKGHALGTIASDDDAVFGIEAQSLGSIKVGGTVHFLRAGAGNDLFNLAAPLGPTRIPGGTGFDFMAFEVPLT